MLSSDLVDDTNNSNKFVTASDIEGWNAKYDFPSGGIPSTDLSSDVQTSLSKADTAIQDVSDKQDVLIAGDNITISSDGKTISATDTTYSEATTETSGLMSATDKTKLNGIESGAEVNVQADWNESSSSSDAYINNKPTIPTDTSDLTNGAGFTTNEGTITSVKMNGTTISSSGEVDLGTVITDISSKQDTLVSGTNIKTINNESLLGSGNINISGGGGTSTDVQMNGTSIVSNNVANIITKTAYNASTNPLATESDLPDISGKQDKIDSSHKLSADLVDDTSTTNKFFSGNYNDLTNKPSLATVATSGSYNDLINKGNSKVYWGYVSGAVALSTTKQVTCPNFVLEEGAIIFVRLNHLFMAGSTKIVALNVNNTGEKNILFPTGTNKLSETPEGYYAGFASDGEFVGFLYNGSNYIPLKGSLATTNRYGVTMLSSSTSSTSETLSATPYAVKQAYDLANSKSDFSGSYNDLTNKPTIPTDTSDLTNGAGYTTNIGTITSIKMNGSTISSSGEADLGTVITQHQDLSGYQTLIDNSNKLSADLISDGNTNKTVTSSEKTTWSGKYDKPSGGIPDTDLSSAVQETLGKVGTQIVSQSGTNLDDYLDDGVYYFGGGVTPTNIPVGTNGWLIVMKSGQDTVKKQIWFRAGTAGTNDHHTYIRTKVNSWSSWTRLLTSKDTDSYSTSETATNKVWIDGKTIYRKCFSVTSTANINTGITHDTIISMQCVAKQKSADSWRNVPWLFTQNDAIATGAWAGGFYYTGGQIRFQVGSSLGDVDKIIVIMEYTKAS